MWCIMVSFSRFLIMGFRGSVFSATPVVLESSHAPTITLGPLFCLFLAVLGLDCYAGFSVGVVSRGFFLVPVCELLVAVLSLVVEHRF